MKRHREVIVKNRNREVERWDEEDEGIPKGKAENENRSVREKQRTQGIGSVYKWNVSQAHTVILWITLVVLLLFSQAMERQGDEDWINSSFSAIHWLTSDMVLQLFLKLWKGLFWIGEDNSLPGVNYLVSFKNRE